MEVPDEWGWGPIRVLRGGLEDDGYWTEEYRMARGVMIRISGSKPAEVADPPAWRGRRVRALPLGGLSRGPGTDPFKRGAHRVPVALRQRVPADARTGCRGRSGYRSQASNRPPRCAGLTLALGWLFPGSVNGQGPPVQRQRRRFAIHPGA